jgi:hypothetical protein
MAVYCESGRLTRRRPIGRDYAAAKDAECGMGKPEFGSGKLEFGSGNSNPFSKPFVVILQKVEEYLLCR